MARVLLECEWVCDKRIKLRLEHHARMWKHLNSFAVLYTALLNCKTVSISGWYYSSQNSTILFSLLVAFFPFIRKREKNLSVYHGIVCHCSAFAFNFKQHMLDMLDGWNVHRSESNGTREEKGGDEGRLNATDVKMFWKVFCFLPNRLERGVRE